MALSVVCCGTAYVGNRGQSELGAGIAESTWMIQSENKRGLLCQLHPWRRPTSI